MRIGRRLGLSYVLMAGLRKGVAPTPEAMADGAYRLTKTYSIVTGPAPGELAKRFIAFVFSDEGAAILRRTGHLPLAPEGGQ